MLLILPIFLFFLFFPLTAWAYFDPGFGGYLVNSIISLIATGFAFVSAAVIYFFRTIIGRKLLFFWQKHQRPCVIALLVILNIGGAALAVFLYYAFHKSSFFLDLLMVWSYFDPGFGKYLSIFFIALMVITFAFISAVIIYFLHAVINRRFRFLQQEYQKHRIIILLFVLSLGCSFLGAFLFCKFSSTQSQSSTTTIFDPQRMCQGYSLYKGELIDEYGRMVKRWSHEYLGVIDKNGDYYGGEEQNELSHENPSWGRYTWNDKVIWEKHFFIHHELYLSPKGTVFIFTKEPHHYNNYNVAFDVILEFDKNGKQLQRYSFWDHLKEFQPYHAAFGIDVASPVILLPLMFFWKNHYQPRSESSYDYFHLNSFYMIPPNPLEGKDPAFRPGNWLISMFHGSMVFILDQDTKKILWHAVGNEVEGGLQGQHSASMLPDGDILLFENGIDRWASRILIIDPLTLKIKWQYRNRDFFSPTQGNVQMLPNGNFLVTESHKSHIFELTPDKKIVWDYYTHNKYEIYRMTRYPKAMIDGLLQKGGS